MSIKSIGNSIAKTVSDGAVTGFHMVSDLTGRTYQILRNLPQEMQNDRNVAIVAFTIANSLFFFTIVNKFANWLHARVNNPAHGPKLEPFQKKIASFLIEGGAVGGTVLGFNVIFSRAFQYPLNDFAKATITIAAIGARSLINWKSSKLEKNNKKEKTEEEQAQEIIQSLKNEKNQMQTTIENLGEEIKGLKQSQQELNESKIKESKNSESAIEKLKIENQILRNDIVQLQKSAIESLKKYEESKKNEEFKENEIKVLTTEINILKKNDEDSKKVIQDLQKKILEDLKKNDELKKENQALKEKEIELLNKENQELEKRIKLLNEENEELKKKKVEEQKKIDAPQTSIKEEEEFDLDDLKTKKITNS